MVDISYLYLTGGYWPIYNCETAPRILHFNNKCIKTLDFHPAPNALSNNLSPRSHCLTIWKWGGVIAIQNGEHDCIKHQILGFPLIFQINPYAHMCSCDHPSIISETKWRYSWHNGRAFHVEGSTRSRKGLKNSTASDPKSLQDSGGKFMTTSIEPWKKPISSLQSSKYSYYELPHDSQ